MSRTLVLTLGASFLDFDNPLNGLIVNSVDLGYPTVKGRHRRPVRP